MLIDDKIVATENVNTVSTVDVMLILCWHFLLLLFYHLLIFFNGSDHNLKFVQYTSLYFITTVHKIRKT